MPLKKDVPHIFSLIPLKAVAGHNLCSPSPRGQAQPCPELLGAPAWAATWGSPSPEARASLYIFIYQYIFGKIYLRKKRPWWLQGSLPTNHAEAGNFLD